MCIASASRKKCLTKYRSTSIQIDRLFLELKLPPQDAYFKCKHIIEEINNILRYVTMTLLAIWDNSLTEHSFIAARALAATANTSCHRRLITFALPVPFTAFVSHWSHSLNCTPTPIHRSTMSNLPSVCGATCTSSQKRGNSPKNHRTVRRSVHSSSSYWNRCISCSLR